jgi:lipoate synthase
MQSSNNVDILICSLPMLSIDRVPGAPALLKSAAEEVGYTAKGVDLNINFFIEQCNRNINLYNELGCVFRSSESVSDDAVAAADRWIQSTIALFQKINPKIIGLSVFSMHQHRATILLTQAIRQYLPNVKIVLGGFGVNISSNSLVNFLDTKKIDLIKPFNLLVTEKKLCDYVVVSDSLNNLINILSEVVGPPSNIKNYSEANKNTIYKSPIPNYDDYNLDEYVWNDNKSIPITGSKGCVRACTFCEVPDTFGKFKYRTGTDIAKEMIYLHKKYNINTFEFTDSLVNGSLKAFTEWLTVIADYNDRQPLENKLHWFGQYICRPQASTPDNIYSLMYRSGVTSLSIGVESGSDAVLEAMQKKITTKDAFDELEQFKKHKINVSLLIMSGFYNESLVRFEETLDFIIRCKQYLADGTVYHLNVGKPLYINEFMHLHKAADELGIIIDPYDDANWKIVDDPLNDMVERARRRLITQLILDKLGVESSAVVASMLTQVLQSLKNYKKTLVDNLNITEVVDDNHNSQRNLDFLVPPKFLEMLELDQFELNLKVYGTPAASNWPNMRVKINNQVIYDNPIIETVNVNYKHQLNELTPIELDIEFYGKTEKDTVLLNDVIVENKHVTLVSMSINGIDIIDTGLIYKLGKYYMKLSDEKMKYFNENKINTEPSHSLDMYENGSWKLLIPTPVIPGFISLRTQSEKHSVGTDLKILNEMYDTIINIRKLETMIDYNGQIQLN